jgi:hypothetical protein
MRATRKTRGKRSVAFLVAGVVGVAVAGCGGDDFENEPRPAVAVELTGVIQTKKITISPDKVGAGPVLITISNQTDEAHTVTLEGAPPNGEQIEERVGPINPLDTATIQKTLPQGTYEVRAGSDIAVASDIRAAELRVGRPRKDSSDRLLLP